MCCLISRSRCSSGLAAKPRLAGSLDGSGYSVGIVFLQVTCEEMLALGWLRDQTHKPRLPGRSGSGLIDGGNRWKAGMPMAEIRTAHLMTMTLSVAGMQAIGATPSGNRRIGLVSGGKFVGERLRGTVLPGGADWIMVRGDGSTTLDVRLVL